MDGEHLPRPNRRLNGRVIRLWYATSVPWAAAAIVVATLWSVSLGLPPAVPVVVGVASSVAAAIVPPLRYRMWRYELRRRDLLLSRGALFHVLTLIPFDRVQFVETRQGPLDRLFRLAQVAVYTAAGRAGQIPGLDPGEAEALREELSKVAGTDAV